MKRLSNTSQPRSSDSTQVSLRPPLEGEWLGPAQDNPHSHSAEDIVGFDKLKEPFVNIEDVYRTVRVDLNQDAGIKIIPDIFHKDGTLNEDALNQRRRNTEWHRNLMKERAAEEQADIRDAWIASGAPFVIAGIVALVLIVFR